MCGFYESKLNILLYRKCLNKHNSDVFALFNFLDLPLHHHRQSDFDSVLHWSPGWPWMCDSVASPSGGVQAWITTARRLLFFASRTFKLSSSSQKSSFSYQAVFFPGFWEFGSLFFSRHKNLHVLKSGMVANFCLESHLVFWCRLTCVFMERMIILIIREDKIAEVFPVSNKHRNHMH